MYDQVLHPISSIQTADYYYTGASVSVITRMSEMEIVMTVSLRSNLAFRQSLLMYLLCSLNEYLNADLDSNYLERSCSLKQRLLLLPFLLKGNGRRKEKVLEKGLLVARLIK